MQHKYRETVLFFPSEAQCVFAPRGLTRLPELLARTIL